MVLYFMRKQKNTFSLGEGGYSYYEIRFLLTQVPGEWRSHR